MTKQNLLTLLLHWLKCESCVDREGYISPSKTAIDITHFYFIKSNKFTKTIDEVRIDQQGGIIITFASTNQPYKFMLHVLFDGVVDYYKINKNNKAEKERLHLNNDEKGFGTTYQF